MKIDWDKVWIALQGRRERGDYFFQMPYRVRKNLQSLVESQLRQKVKRRKK